jgi:oligosaccharyltransferase complex subunit delta (ribophorin II)
MQTQKDLPIPLLLASEPLTASLIIASFGASTPYKSKAFEITVERDPNAPIAAGEPPVRYGKLEEIHHIFRSDPKSPPKIITLVFAAAVLGALPILVGVWLALGANFSHLSKAFGSAPLSHILFFSSLIALETIFGLYYTSWNLFQTLPAAAAVGAVAFLSGRRALSEVQERRLAGLR